jgi:uncharacterized phiE125 gp8 family phage protein
MLIITPDYVTQTVAPTAEPVTRTEAKLHLRVTTTADDTLIDSLIQASREYVELYTRRAFVQRTYRADVEYFSDEIQLPYAPIASITHVKYYTAASPQVLTTLDAVNYALTRDVIMRSNVGVWPAVYPRPDAVQITYVAGYASTSSPVNAASGVPAAIKAAIHLTIADLYENREGQIVFPGQIQENKTVMRLLNSYRIYA